MSFGLYDSEMARPIKLKLGGIVEGICKNNLVKYFFFIFGIQDGRQMNYIAKKRTMHISNIVK